MQTLWAYYEGSWQYFLPALPAASTMAGLPPVASLFVVLRAATPSSQLTVTLLRLGDLPPGWIADSSSGGGGGSGSSDVLCGILAGTRFPDPLGGAEAEFASSIALGSLSGAYAVVHSVAVFSRANADATMAQYRGAFATCSGATFDLDGTLFTMTAEPVALTLPRGSTVAVRLILGPPIALDIVLTQVGDRVSFLLVAPFRPAQLVFTTQLATAAASRL